MSAMVWKNVGTPAYEAFLNGVEKRTQVDNKRSVIAGTTSIGHMLSAQSSIPQSL